MERLYIRLFCMACMLYSWLGETQVEGKCSGRWAIHACGGGNGKRASVRFLAKGVMTRQEPESLIDGVRRNALRNDVDRNDALRGYDEVSDLVTDLSYDTAVDDDVNPLNGRHKGHSKPARELLLQLVRLLQTKRRM